LVSAIKGGGILVTGLTKMIGGTTRVLLFSEDELELEQEMDLLQGAGFLVDLAEALSTAVHCLRVNMPDVAILHSHHKGDAASLLAATILLKYRGTRVVVITSHDDPDADANLKALGVTRMVRGPVPFHELLELVKQKDVVKPRMTQYSAVSRSQLDALENLHQRSPNEPDTQWLLGFAYYRAGRYHEAVPLLERLSQGREAQAQVRYYLGSCYYNLESHELAQKYWRMAASQKENSTIASRAKEHLERLDQERADG
jgi:tetratricopeptide (TPR) repeat protein